MFSPNPSRNRQSRTAALRTIRFGIGCAFKNEVAVSILIAACHTGEEAFGHLFSLPKWSAMVLRSASIARMSASRILVRRCFSASFSTAFAARVASA